MSARRRLAITVVLVGAVLVACTPLPTRDLRASASERAEAAAHPLSPPSTTGFAPANATPEQRAATAEMVWKTIADLFYDPTYNGIDIAVLRARTSKELDAVRSDADFYRVLKRNVAAMKDSHTAIEDPQQAQNFRNSRSTAIGIGFTSLEGRIVVTRVVPDFPAAVAGVRVGMLVERIDEQALDEAFFAQAKTAPPDPAANEPTALGAADADREARLRAVRRLLAASPTGETRPHRIVFRAEDDRLVAATLEARAGEIPTREGYFLLPSGVGFLGLTRFDSTMTGLLARDIERARNESRALIIDLRGNGGGEVRLFQWLVSEFEPRHETLVETLERAGGNKPIESVPAKKPYLKPIAILTDRGTASAAELTSHALVELRSAISVGEPTCGCVVGVAYDYVLPDGGVLRVAQVGFRSAHGRRMEADPLLPTIPVTPTLAQLRVRDDPAVSAAEKALLAR